MNLSRALSALFLLAALVPATASAQTPAKTSDADIAAARELTRDGYTALDKNDYATAADRFSRAEGLYKAPTITVGLGRAYAGLGKLVAAHEAFNRVINMKMENDANPALVKAVEDARRELAALSPRVPAVILEVKGPDVPKVTVDGTPVPALALGVKRLVDPGPHVVRATAQGFFPVETTVTLAEGKIETVRLELKQDPNGPAPQTAQDVAAGQGQAQAGGSLGKTLGFTSLGVGATGLVMGAITGGVAIGKHNALATACPNNRCPSSHQTEVDSYMTMSAISTAGFIGGGVLAATGVVLVLVAPKAAPVQTGSLVPVVGPGYLGVQGRF